MRNQLIAVVASVAAAGCTNVVWVKEVQPAQGGASGDANGKVTNQKVTYQEVPGIPFFVKTERLRQTTVRTQTWLRATLKDEGTTIGISGNIRFPKEWPAAPGKEG